jgi:L-ascorbate metabolism protein UlaG (beta-lactamase superfamily)
MKKRFCDDEFMITPFQAHDALLADIANARREPASAHLWWLGQSGFLLHAHGRHLLLDPYLSDSLTKKYAATDKPHVRMTELIIDPRRLDFIDVVTSSHNHTDHLDAETLRPLLQVNANLTLVVAAANVDFAAERLHVPPERLTAVDVGGSVQVAGFTIHPVPAAHESIDRDALGRCRFVGFVVEFAGKAIYHSGDTVLYEGMAQQLRRWRIDIALLPINGRAPERRVAGNLWGREAASLAKAIDARIVIPCHYEMFEFNTATTEEFISAAHEIDQPICVLRAGERYSLH